MDLDWHNANLFKPSLKVLCDEFGAVDRSNYPWFSSLEDQIKQYVQHVIGIHLWLDGHTQSSSCVFIDNGQDFVSESIC